MSVLATPQPGVPPEKLAAGGLRTFFRVAEAWGLSVEEQATLLGVTRATVYKWKAAPPGRLSPDTLERLSYVFGIWKALTILIPERTFRLRWVRQANTNPLFGGETPLARMLSGRVSDLYLVRRYVDGERGG